MIRLAFLIAALGAATPGLAADGRVRTLFYDPATVVTVAGQPGIQSTIEFAPDERIENVAIGDSAAWQVTPNRRASLLFLKPISAGGRTNMTVVTDRRTYMFDLVAHRKTAAPLYALRFQYPLPVLPASSPAKVDTPLVRVDTRPVALDLDFGWAGKGAKQLLPRRAFDDGRALYLAWDKGSALPAMLAVDPQGSEGPVNYSIKGDYIVIEQIPERLVLRSGRETATLGRAGLNARTSAKTASNAP